MRPLHLSDLHRVVRTLLAIPHDKRADLLARLMHAAQLAGAHHAATGRQHPKYGSGALGDACQAFAQAPTPDWCDGAYLEALHLVVTALIPARAAKR